MSKETDDLIAATDAIISCFVMGPKPVSAKARRTFIDSLHARGWWIVATETDRRTLIEIKRMPKVVE